MSCHLSISVLAKVVVLAAVLLLESDLSRAADNSSALNQELAEKQYSKAVALRRKVDASNKELRQAALLLKSAGGVKTTVQPPELDALIAAHASNTSQDEIDWLRWEHPGLEVANQSHTGALKELAIAYETGEGIGFNPAAAWQLIRTAAQRGDATAQAELGFRLALGIYPPPPPPTGKPPVALFELGRPRWPEALAYYFFAAAGNDSFAQMALGFRHAHGLGVPRSCQAAVLFYQPVAEAVVDLARRPGTLPQVDRVRLSSLGSQRPQPSHEQQVLHYQWFADLGNTEAQRLAGQMLSQGARRNPAQALRYFRQAAEAGDADAMAHLGHMFANGAGVAASNASALRWFQQAADRGHASALYGLGYLHLAGFGVPKDAAKALTYFSAAAKEGHTEAYFHLGVMHLNGWGVRANPAQALQYFSQAARNGHLLAQYNLAMMHLSGAAADKAGCTAALELLKKVAERGPRASVLGEAYEWYAAGAGEEALAAYLRAGELGLEQGQSNAAWLLAHGHGPPGSAAGRLAIKMHQRAAGQGNVEALLQLGDSHWYGRGAAPDWVRAGQLYSAAARFRNAQAVFNLGAMHEFGAGLPQDLHLAKRYYDKALEYQPDARLPVQLALASLALHSWFEGVRPYLPQRLDWLWTRMYTLSNATLLSKGGNGEGGLHLGRENVGLGLGWLEALLDSGVRGGRGEGRLAGLLSDTGETALLLGLCGLLWLVLWRRRTLRARRRAPQDAGNNGPGTHGMMPAESTRHPAVATGSAQPSTVAGDGQQPLQPTDRPNADNGDRGRAAAQDTQRQSNPPHQGPGSLNGPGGAGDTGTR